MVVGPFVGEVGYELLYWRPFVLHLLRSRGVDPERVTVVSRGGAGAWYAPVASRWVDAFEIVSPEVLRKHVEERLARTGERKQTQVDELDRRLVDAVRERVGDAIAVHPRFMYWRSRYLWERLRPPEDARVVGDYDDLPPYDLDPAVEERLPPGFVAVKAYLNDCVADERSAESLFAPAVSSLRERGVPVVLLAAGVASDDHRDWTSAGSGIVEVFDLFAPETNLAAQAEIVRRALALVATYGGFSYVGPFSGTPTLALASTPEDNPAHEDVLRAVRPEAVYVRSSDGSAIDSLMKQRIVA